MVTCKRPTYPLTGYSTQVCPCPPEFKKKTKPFLLHRSSSDILPPCLSLTNLSPSSFHPNFFFNPIHPSPILICRSIILLSEKKFNPFHPPIQIYIYIGHSLNPSLILVYKKT